MQACGNFVPRGRLACLERFPVVTARGRVPLASRVWGPGPLLRVLQRTGQPPAKSCPAPNDSSAKLRNPTLIVPEGHVLRRNKSKKSVKILFC